MMKSVRLTAATVAAMAAIVGAAHAGDVTVTISGG